MKFATNVILDPYQKYLDENDVACDMSCIYIYIYHNTIAGLSQQSSLEAIENPAQNPAGVGDPEPLQGIFATVKSPVAPPVGIYGAVAPPVGTVPYLQGPLRSSLCCMQLQYCDKNYR
jgi:hypothetical protein